VARPSRHRDVPRRRASPHRERANAGATSGLRIEPRSVAAQPRRAHRETARRPRRASGGDAGELTLAIPADTLRQRPDVRADEERLRAALARVDAAQAARLPSLNLSGSFGAAGTTLGALTGGGAGVTALLANLTVPLFDGGARRSQVRAQEAAFDQAQASYRASVLGALQEAEDALATLYGDRERLEHLRAAADSAANAWLLAQQRYSSGIIDFQVVLETQRTLLNAQDNVATAEGDLSVDHVRLYKALGGGWEPDLLADDGSR
jgi:outer membrane protein TolC